MHIISILITSEFIQLFQEIQETRLPANKLHNHKRNQSTNPKQALLKTKLENKLIDKLIK